MHFNIVFLNFLHIHMYSENIFLKEKKDFMYILKPINFLYL